MKNENLNKKLHSANSYLSVVYGYLQLLESEISKRSESKKTSDLQWIKKSLKACKDLKKIILEIEKEVKATA